LSAYRPIPSGNLKLVGMGRVVHAARRTPEPATLEVLHRGAGNWATSRKSAQAAHPWPEWRARGQAIRADAIRHLPELLDEFEAQVVRAGGVVHRAADAAAARATIARLCTERSLTRAIKSKSMLSEEIGLNAALETAGMEVVETDLGEWILQLLGERSSHILAPAIHVSAEQVAELFSDHAGEAYDAEDTRKLVGYARGALREAFLAGDVGITGVNIAVAQTGTLILVESEGNIRLCSSLPRVHIALMGIEKVVRDWEGAAHLVELLPLAAHGKPAATYTSYVTGVADDDGPDELHVVLVDDGRSALRGTDLESALHCIRCGACLYACPVYRQVGGHAYGAAYSGPIGAVITPALEGSKPPSDELPWLSSLCGACTEACPVGIPLDEHLITLRARAKHGGAERAFWEGWARLWSRPSTYRATAATAGRALKPLWRAAGGEGWTSRSPTTWTDGRDARAPAAEPFHVRWRHARGR
jgi:L-lactate dehydrogenase complex protein LldF